MNDVASAKTKYLKITARKLRLTADEIRNKSVNEAFALLAVSKKKGADIVNDTLKSAVANVSNHSDASNIDVDHLWISEILVDEGPTQKRWMPRAMGRASQILKRTSHLSIKLAQK